MGSDFELFCRAMDGLWRVVHLDPQDGDEERVKITYESVAVPGLKWSHTAFAGYSIPRVGTLGRIGFMTV